MKASGIPAVLLSSNTVPYYSSEQLSKFKPKGNAMNESTLQKRFRSLDLTRNSL